MAFNFVKQADQMDCERTCLRMVAAHYGRKVSLQKLREISRSSKSGVSMPDISEAAEKIGFRTSGIKVSPQTLNKIELPMLSSQ